MATDWEGKLYTLLQNNWNGTNVAKPPMYYKDDTANAAPPLIKIYYVDGPPYTPHGLAWHSNEIEARVSIDIKTGSRDMMLKYLDEVKRILDLKAVGWYSVDGYDHLYNDGDRKVSGYTNFQHYVVDVRFKILRKVR